MIIEKDIMKICRRFGISCEWLTNGTGEMHGCDAIQRTLEKQYNNHVESNAWNICSDSAVLQKELEMLHIENERLHKEIDWLRSLVEQKLK